MIQHAHLTAWQAHAPWPKRSQIEQDLRLSRGVAAIFTDSVLSEHLAMRGGTVLHKAHLAPAARYSEDIDLVLVKLMDTETLAQHLRRALTPVLGQPADSLIADAWLTIRNVLRPSRILRTTYRFVPLGLRREESIKVEINLNENASLYLLVSVELDTLDDDGETVRATARSYDINEMLGTKMRALMQREQGRDLFDLVHVAPQ
jgi:predicted nucleotidyltransferase component of viral defense system